MASLENDRPMTVKATLERETSLVFKCPFCNTERSVLMRDHSVTRSEAISIANDIFKTIGQHCCKAARQQIFLVE
jgi:transcription elongation factor Elf1